MSSFVDSPIGEEWIKTPPGYKGGPGVYDGDDCPGFAEYRRTPSPNGVPEKIIDGSVPKPSGENDQF